MLAEERQMKKDKQMSEEVKAMGSGRGTQSIPVRPSYLFREFHNGERCREFPARPHSRRR